MLRCLLYINESLHEETLKRQVCAYVLGCATPALKNQSENNIWQNEQPSDSDKNQERSNSLASFEDGLYVHAVMEAIRRSSREKTWSKVNVVDETKEK